MLHKIIIFSLFLLLPLKSFSPGFWSVLTHCCLFHRHRTLDAVRRRRRRASAPHSIATMLTGRSQSATRRSRVAMASVRAPRVAMVLAVTRGAAALRRCARKTAIRGASLLLPISFSSSFPRQMYTPVLRRFYVSHSTLLRVFALKCVREIALILRFMHQNTFSERF